MPNAKKKKPFGEMRTHRAEEKKNSSGLKISSKNNTSKAFCACVTDTKPMNQIEFNRPRIKIGKSENIKLKLAMKKDKSVA